MRAAAPSSSCAGRGQVAPFPPWGGPVLQQLRPGPLPKFPSTPGSPWPAALLLILCWDEGRITLCRAGIQQRFLVVAIVPPHQETQSLSSDKPRAHSEPWKGLFLMHQFPSLSQGLLVFSMMGPYIFILTYGPTLFHFLLASH